MILFTFIYISTTGHVELIDNKRTNNIFHAKIIKALHIYPTRCVIKVFFFKVEDEVELCLAILVLCAFTINILIFK